MRQKLWVNLAVCCFIVAGFGLQAAGQNPGFRVEGVGSVAIPVTAEKMTNLIFPEAVQVGVKVSRDVLVQKVRGVENVIEVMAARRNFLPTNLSVYGKDGRLYSFVLHYTADSVVLNFRVVAGVGRGFEAAPVMLEGLPAGLDRLKADGADLAGQRGFLHRRVREAGIGLRLAGVYMRDSLEWLVLVVSNGTQIPFHAGFVRYYVEDRRRVRRKAMQEWEVAPVVGAVDGEVGGEQTMRYAVGFSPFAVAPGKRLVVAVAGVDGRMVRLRVKPELLLRAKAE